MTPFASELEKHEPDAARVRLRMRARLGGPALVGEIGGAALEGGKRLRAVVCVLSGRLCGADPAVMDEAAAGVELIHAATLLHDDVVDDAPTRRTRPTANRLHGSAAAVLVGDFLYSRASQIFAELGNLRMLARIADATNRLAEGEVLQLLARRHPELDEEKYFAVIERKTANLFEAASAGGAILSGRDGWENGLAEYGRRLGRAFQIVDDCLDYEGEGAETGKEIGRDFAEGQMTLPALLALSRAGVGARERLLRGWRSGDADSFGEALRLARETGALAESRGRAESEAALAAQSLEAIAAEGGDAKVLEALTALAKLSAGRRA